MFFYVGRCVLMEWVVGGRGKVSTSGNRDYPWACKSDSKDFTEDALAVKTSNSRFGF